MKTIVGFGALNLDLIFEVEDLKTISSNKSPLEPGKEAFGSDEDFQQLLEKLNRFGILRSKFLAGVFWGKSLEESALFATNIAAKSLTGYGRDQYPTREDMERILIK